MPLMGVAMACGGVLRALGEAKNAMNLTLIAAAVNAALDPIFIFALGWEIRGAAVATVCARLAMAGFGLWIVIRHHQLLGNIQIPKLAPDIKHYFSIAFPAVLTNLSTPIGLAYITYVMAGFGDEAVAGQAIVGRLQPVAFAGLFALSGAVGPIAAQNLGAQQFPRIFETLHKSVIFVLGYCAVASSLLLIATPLLIQAFKVEGLTADIVRWFCYGFSLIFIFNGATFVTNALFNNLRAATYATQFNFGKATLGTMPFAYFGGLWGGPLGVYWGVLIGAAIVAALGVWVCERHIRKLRERETEPALG
jgi:Na+-driven multidrug efflux pump